MNTATKKARSSMPTVEKISRQAEGEGSLAVGEAVGSGDNPTGSEAG